MSSVFRSFVGYFVALFPEETLGEKMDSNYYWDLAAYYNASRYRTVSRGARLWFEYCFVYARWKYAIMLDEEQNKEPHMKRRMPPDIYTPTGFGTTAPTKEQRAEAREAYAREQRISARIRWMARPIMNGSSGFPENTA